MLIKEIMNTDVKTIEQTESVHEAAKTMSEYDIGSLLVTKGDKLVGIITKMDIIRKVVSIDVKASSVKVSDIMTKEVIMVDPDIDVEEAAELMMDKKIKKLPVVDKGSLIGIVTSTDICTAEPRLIRKLADILLLPGTKKTVAG
ncbi:MAG: CBS domain-containing protein [Candidatus Aenigmarchaeota archaeon]|nr:CBS domain-containing protein [Candidatus Aenigmarchaeota archaeon]